MAEYTTRGLEIIRTDIGRIADALEKIVDSLKVEVSGKPLEEECKHGWVDLGQKLDLAQCAKCKIIRSKYEIAVMAGMQPRSYTDYDKR